MDSKHPQGTGRLSRAIQSLRWLKEKKQTIEARSTPDTIISLLVKTLVSMVKRTTLDKAWSVKRPSLPVRRRASCRGDAGPQESVGFSITRITPRAYMIKHRAGDEEIRQGISAQPRL